MNRELGLENLLPQGPVTLDDSRVKDSIETIVEKFGLHPKSEKGSNLKAVLENTAALVTNSPPLRKKMATLALENVTSASNISPILSWIFPILGRAWPKLIAQDLVSVQPVNTTIGIIRRLMVEYGANKGIVRAGDKTPASFSSKNITFSRYYSGPYIEKEVVADSITSGNSTTHELEYFAVGMDLKLQGIAGTSPFTVYVPLDGTSVNFGAGSSASYDATTNTLTVNASGEDLTNIVVSYETSLEAVPWTPDLTIRIVQDTLRVRMRSLRVAFTLQAQLEIAAHGISDFKAKLSALMGDQIQLEIDRTILSELIEGAKTDGYVTDVKLVGTTLGEFLKRQPITQWMNNLLYYLSITSAAIYKRTRRARANWIVTSPAIAGLMESTGLIYKPSDTMDYGTSVDTIVPLGFLNGRWKVYVDPFFPEDTILMGYKGNSPYDSGYVYAPYSPVVPLDAEKLGLNFVDVPNLTFHTAMFSAFATKMYDSGFYHVIRILDLDQLLTYTIS